MALARASEGERGMSDTPEDIARRAADRLAREIDPALPAVVEGQLRGGGGAEPPTGPRP